MNLKQYLIKTTGGVFFVKIIATMLSLVLSVVYARVMGAKEYGRIVYVISIITLLNTVVLMGLPQYIVREIARNLGAGQFSLVKGMMKFAYILVLVTVIIVSILYFVGTYFFLDNIKQQYLFWLGLPMILLLALNVLRAENLRAFRQPVKAQMPEQIIRPVFILVVALFGAIVFDIQFDAEKMMFVNIVSALVSFFIGSFFLYKSIPSDVKKAAVDMTKLIWFKGMMSFFLLGGLGILNSRIDLVMVGSMRNSEETAYYRIAITASMIVSFMLMAVNQTIAPVIADLYHRKELDTLQMILTKSVRIVSSFTLLAITILYIFGEWLLGKLYGERFLPAFLPMLILASAQLFNSTAGSVGNVMNMSGHQNITTKVFAFTALFNVIANFIMIPVWGISGAAAATGFSLILWNLIMVFLLYKKTGLKSYIR